MPHLNIQLKYHISKPGKILQNPISHIEDYSNVTTDKIPKARHNYYIETINLSLCGTWFVKELHLIYFRVAFGGLCQGGTLFVPQWYFACV